jgi:hypothetical protein
MPDPHVVHADVIVPCYDTRESLDGALCTGEFRYGPTDMQAQCTVCGGWRGRGAPDNVLLDLADARREIDRLRALLELAEQHARDTQDELVPEAADEAYQRGLADGRAQATEGWEREWAVAFADKTWPPNDSEQSARTFAALYADGQVVSRLVGPWEPAEQTEGGDR